MVATAADAPPKRGQSISRTRALKHSVIPVPTKLRARNLYVIQQLPAKEVAAACGLTETQVYALSSNLGWAKLRAQGRAKLSEPLQAREQAELESISHAAASLSDEGLLGSLQRAVKATSDQSDTASKDCQAFASAARSLMQVGRTLRGLDNRDTQQRDVTAINLFVGRFGPAVGERSEKNITPSEQPSAIDVAAKPA